MSKVIRQDNLPNWARDILVNFQSDQVQADRRSRFIPDKAAYDADFAAKLAMIGGELGFSQDKFFGDLASRGILQSGEAAPQYVRQVLSPLQNAANAAATASQLGYQQFRQQGEISAEQIQMQAINQLIRAVQESGSVAGIKQSGFADFLGSVIGAGLGAIL